jgi:hypothetical protein
VTNSTTHPKRLRRPLPLLLLSLPPLLLLLHQKQLEGIPANFT